MKGGSYGINSNALLLRCHLCFDVLLARLNIMIATICGDALLRPLEIGLWVISTGARSNSFLNGDRSVSGPALPSVPFLTHQARGAEKPIHPGGVLVGPPRQPITKGKVGLGVGGIPGYIPGPQGGKLHPVAALLGFFNQCHVIHLDRARRIGRRCGFLRFGPHHILLQHSGQLFPTFLHLKTGRQSVAGHSNKPFGTTSYVHFYPKVWVFDIISVFVIVESRRFEQNTQSVSAGRILRIALHHVHHIKGQRGQFTVVVNAVVNVDCAHIAKDTHTQPVITAPLHSL